MNFECHVPSASVYGKGSRFDLAARAASISISNPLIVSDEYLNQTGIVKTITDRLSDEGMKFAVFTDIKSEPTMTDVDAAVRVFKANNCDGVICIGGGSAIDTAKAAAAMAVNPGTIADYMGYHKVKCFRVPLIALPTTSGTGSEATRVVVITDTDRDIKMMCLDKAFLPDIAILDYELTMSMPKSLTAFVGMDALTHAIEAYVSIKASAITDIFALKAIEMISNDILTAYNHPDDESARENMMIGSNMAGTAFSNASVCAVHGMSRPIGAYFHVPHGLSNAMLLPVVTGNSITGNIKRYADVAVRMGFDAALSDEELAGKVMEKLRFLNKELSIPNLKVHGIDKVKFEEAIPKMVEAAIASGSPANNPKVFTPEEMTEIYLKAFDYS